VRLDFSMLVVDAKRMMDEFNALLDNGDEQGKVDGERRDKLTEAVTSVAGRLREAGLLRKMAEMDIQAREDRIACEKLLQKVMDAQEQAKLEVHQEAVYLVRDEAMCDFACDDEPETPYNPKLKFAWRWGDEGVPNPQHPYWKGYEFGTYLRESGACGNRHSIWYGAYERDPQDGRCDQHPFGLKSSRGYFDGIRHGYENLQMHDKGS
jgi:hypothetical protein